QIINSIQQGLAAELDFQAIVDLVGDKLREVFNTLDLAINWYDEKTNLIHYLYNYEHGERNTFTPRPPTSGGIFERMVKNRQPVVWNTINEGDAISPVLPGTDESKSGASVPIISSDRVLGSLQLENYERENVYGESELRLLTTIAASLGTALENARLFDETQRLLKETEERNAELAIINSIGQALTQELDLHSLVELVGDKLRAAIQTENIGIGLYNTNTNLITSIYAYKNGQQIHPDPSPLNDYSLRFSRQGKSLVLNEVTEEMWKKFGSNLTFGREIPKSVIMVPILAGGELIGGITVQNFKNKNAYPDSIVRLLETIASNMGTAIQNARLFAETQRLLQETEQRNAELAIINSVQDALAAKLDIQGIYNSVGDKIREIFKAYTTFIAFHDAENNRIVAPYYIDRGIRPSITSRPYGKGLNEVIIESGKPLLLNTYEETAKAGAFNIASPDSDKDLNESFLGVPIFRNGKAIGATAVQSYKRFAYNQNDLRLLATLTNSMGVALENARLFDETQRLLKETEERNAELAIINSVQAALAAELNIQGIYDAVGDKIHEIFHNTDMGIRIYDSQTHLIHIPYCYEQGERITIEPYPLRDKGFVAHVLRTRETLVINENMEKEEQKYGGQN
ncbi:MAG: GAF domain-containing protein, partial [Anaerolineales bacterium]|nr:GAF domain-containing protein [Anaerolineales bacterium]